MIRQHAHWVERFLSSSSSDDNFFVGKQAPTSKNEADVSDQFIRFGQASFSNKSRCEMSFGGFDDVCATLSQCIQIFLCCRVLEHAAIHCGRDHKRRGACERSNREKGIRLTMRKFGNCVCCARCDDQQVGVMSQAHMQNMRFIPPRTWVI